MQYTGEEIIEHGGENLFFQLEILVLNLIAITEQRKVTICLQILTYCVCS